MGTNFYLLNGEHIGKRSSAGFYCWDCKITLCKGGENAVHSGKQDWYLNCPVCGKTRMEESLRYSSAGRELGFNKSEPVIKKGVKSCSSFSWAMDKARLKKIKLVEDEYGRKYTRNEFNLYLLECPIQFFDLVGREFS